MNGNAAFKRLAPEIQQALYDMEWESLRPIQEQAIHAVLDTPGDLLISARTASGKTEAAFLPILSQIADKPKGSIRVLYISPLRALINDQFRRLEELCRRSQIPVHRWHKDVSQSHRQKLIRDPGGVLAITPESVEAMLLRRSSQMSTLVRELQFVVIDELHAFVGRERGIHLRSLMQRLERYVSTKPRFIALSATLGQSFDVYRSWLRPDAVNAVRVIEDPPAHRELDFTIHAFEITEEDEEDAPKKSRHSYEFSADLVKDALSTFVGEKNLLFGNRKDALESLADVLNEHCEQDGRLPEFFVHHGSLSKEVREQAEERMQSPQPSTLLCTSTLELGIDVGRVRMVGQLGPTWSVGSLVQRIGRSGRRKGDRPRMRMYLQHFAGAKRSGTTAPLMLDLAQAIAMAELMYEKWVETPKTTDLDLSTLVHQILAIIAETGGIPAMELFARINATGVFNQVSQELFVAVLRCLGGKQVIEQVSTGELVLGTVGEKVVNHYDFYSVFLTPLEYDVKHVLQAIGTLPAVAVPLVKDHFILANRRWQVESIDTERLLIQVVPSKARKPPKFPGEPGEIDPVVRRKMRKVLLTDESYDYLNPMAVEWLHGARQEAARIGLRNQDVVEISPNNLYWFAWTGTRAQRTLLLAGRKAGIEMEDANVAIHAKCSASSLKKFATEFASRPPSAEELAALIPWKQMRKFDRFLSDDLLTIGLARNCIDIPEAQRVAATLKG